MNYELQVMQRNICAAYTNAKQIILNVSKQNILEVEHLERANKQAKGISGEYQIIFFENNGTILLRVFNTNACYQIPATIIEINEFIKKFERAFKTCKAKKNQPKLILKKEVTLVDYTFPYFFNYNDISNLLEQTIKELAA